MRIINEDIILKLKTKNRGNKILCSEIDKLIADLEAFDSKNEELKDVRTDADCVHSKGFYFFNIFRHRALILIMSIREMADIIWAGSHQEYETTFRNNRATIEKWLRKRNYID